MTEILAAHVTGTAVTKGSKKIVPEIVTKSGKRVPPRLVDEHPDQIKRWQARVVEAVKQTLPDGWRPEAGPVAVVLRFAVKRPASEPRERRGWPIPKNKNDIDKLTRAVLDALTQAGVFGDDSQVVDLDVKKRYPGQEIGMDSPGVRIWVHRLGAPVNPTPEGLTTA